MVNMSKKQTTYECPECRASASGAANLDLACMGEQDHPGVGVPMPPEQRPKHSTIQSRVKANAQAKGAP
jgi:hypothetical protein